MAGYSPFLAEQTVIIRDFHQARGHSGIADVAIRKIILKNHPRVTSACHRTAVIRYREDVAYFVRHSKERFRSLDFLYYLVWNIHKVWSGLSKKRSLPANGG
jgi:hypothetical protein